MKRMVAVIVLVAAVVSACGGGGDSQETALDGPTLPATSTSVPSTTAPASETTAVPPTTTAAAPAPSTSPRGLIVKQLGQEGAVVGDGGNHDITFAVDSIEVDNCPDGSGGPAEQGHFVVVSVRLSVAATAPANYYVITYDDWSIISPDGVVENANTSGPAFGCVSDAERFPDGPLLPSTQLVGKFALDTGQTSGFLTFTPAFIRNGWEWSF